MNGISLLFWNGQSSEEESVIIFKAGDFSIARMFGPQAPGARRD
jgi:hypothetical protein